MSAATPFDMLLKQSRVLRENFSLILTAASSTSLVLISGEEGTERELLARLIHLLCPRSRRPFIGFSCARDRRDFVNALTGGAESAAETRPPGILELAQSGTLFLDGIESLEIREQIFLKTLIERSRPVSGSLDSIRFILGADESLRRRVEDGGFYSGLYYTIAVLEIALSPLRQRKEDIVPLARFILGGEMEGRHLTLSLDAVPHLLAYDWPGNYRELKLILSRAATRTRGKRIRAEDLPEHIRFSRYWATATSSPSN
ncbi:MAG: sigma 54-interacting transcriptional regulator [Candidatus Aureabacteria bacterium]|nr:sigma 54-interacting transcriptional regulator [Candidatus Auribacterota bacterium]